MGAGFYLMHRDWMDNPALDPDEPYDRRSAWVWLIEHAAFEAMRVKAGAKIVSLMRGQLSYSLRYLAEAWGWRHQKVRRFLACLESETMIETACETGQMLITICNYDKYQAAAEIARQPARQATRQERDSDETNKKELKQLEEDSLKGVSPRAHAEAMLAIWGDECSDLLGNPRKLSSSRITHCSARLRDLHGDTEAWREFCRRVRRSQFLTGGNKSGWRASLDWVLKPDNFNKILEGNYDDRAIPLFSRKPSAQAEEFAAFESVSR